MIRSSSSYHKEINYNANNSRKCDTDYTISAYYCTLPVVELPPKCLQLLLPFETIFVFIRLIISIAIGAGSVFFDNFVKEKAS